MDDPHLFENVQFSPLGVDGLLRKVGKIETKGLIFDHFCIPSFMENSTGDCLDISNTQWHIALN